MANLICGVTELSAGEEALWPGGEATLYSAGECVLRVRHQDSADWHDTDIRVLATNPTVNFRLGKGFMVSLSAAGSIHPITLDIRGGR